MPPRKVLVTRPRADAEPLARRIRALGHEALVEPLLEVRFLEGAKPGDLTGAAALAFTSANGVRALLHGMPDAPRAGLPVFAVGAATARTAREAGFTDVRAAAGDVESLAALIARHHRPEAGAVLHVAGRERAGDLMGALAAAGIEARRAVLYAADAHADLSAATRDALAGGGVTDVVIFSPRTARQFVTLTRRAGLARQAARLRLLALSPRVAEAASGLDFAAVQVARRPDEDALLELLGASSAQGQD